MKKPFTYQFRVVFLLLLISSSCSTYKSKYINEPVHERNNIQKFDRPYFQKEINALGWSINIGLSAGTGILAYNYLPIDGTKNFLSRNGMNWSDGSIRFVQGTSAGLAMFLLNYSLMNYDHSIKAVNSNEDAVEWIHNYNSSLNLVDFSNGEYIQAIPDHADKNFIMNNLSDAKFFSKYFAKSKYADEVITNSLSNFSLEEIPELVGIFSDLDVTSKLKEKIILDSKNIDEWITNIGMYPGIIDLKPAPIVEPKVSTILIELNDVKKLLSTKPNYIKMDFLENQAYSLIRSISDIRLFRDLFPENIKESELETKGIDLIKSYSDELEYKKLFPKGKRNFELDSRSYTLIKSLEEAKLYIKNSKDIENLPKIALQFVNSASDILSLNQISSTDSLIDIAIEKLINDFTNVEIVKILDSVPLTAKMDKLLDKYVSNINNIDEAIIASEKYPDKNDQISIRASVLCSSIRDYRKFLSYFGDTEVAFDIRAKYYEITSKEPENLGKNVNSSIGDYAPVISPDGETLYFCRRDSEDPSHNEDIFFTNIEIIDEWGVAKNIGPPLNNSSHNAVSGVSQDGSMILLHNHYYDNEAGLSASYITSEGWSKPTDLIIPNFYNNSEYHNACLSADGKIIMISSARNDSYGGNDLYVIRQDKDGNWMEPKNIGLQINTWAEESSIFLAADGVTIYFSSDGHNGFGGSDIFMSRRLDNSWTKWSEPENLGEKINTEASERYYVIPASGDFVYYSSYNNTLGQSDIFRIGLPLDKRPNPVVLVSGRVINKKTNYPLASRIYYEDLETGEEIGTVRTNPETGLYKIILPGGKKYGLRAESVGFLPINENVDLTHLKNYKKSLKDLQIVPIERGQISLINNIFFETGKANLKKESNLELDRLYNYMAENPNLNLEVSGHTDDVGADEMNLRLSQRRAASVCNYLLKKGIAKERLSSNGFGETKPVVPNNSASNRAKNRRVEIKFF
jgi:outer membrane protein OmpA-like peptidoglycan-associated protein